MQGRFKGRLPDHGVLKEKMNNNDNRGNYEVCSFFHDREDLSTPSQPQNYHTLFEKKPPNIRKINYQTTFLTEAEVILEFLKLIDKLLTDGLQQQELDDIYDELVKAYHSAMPKYLKENQNQKRV